MAAKKRTVKKTVEMTKPKPVLRCETETVINVEYHDLDAFILAVTGHHYECVANEEWGNDSQHRFGVNGNLSDFEQKDWDKFKATGEEETYLLRTILDGLCKEGHLAPGTYIISVCW